MRRPFLRECLIQAAGYFSRQKTSAGQEVFLRNGLMEYGSIFGHGAYLGPDYTADYLHRAALYVQQRYGGPDSATAVARTIHEFQTNTYTASTQILHYSTPQAEAFDQL